MATYPPMARPRGPVFQRQARICLAGGCLRCGGLP